MNWNDEWWKAEQTAFRCNAPDVQAIRRYVARFRNWQFFTAGVGLIGVLFATIQAYPNWLFSYSRTYHGFAIFSDSPIDPAIETVIDDARRRLSTSSLARPDEQFRVFLCNNSWRLRLFTGNAAIGGGTSYATRNIFIRASDIPSNTVRAPSGGVLLDEIHRPLSYFIAHEATHVLLLRRYGLVAMLRSPFWLVEGYADHVAKVGDFDLSENRRLLRRHDGLLSDEMARRGLYRRYQVMVETALSAKGATIDTLFADPPQERRLVTEARG